MKPTPILRAGACVAAAAFLVASCTRGTQGIFATIEAEERIETNNLVDNTSIVGLVLAAFPGAGDGSERYVSIAGTKVFQRTVDSSSWSKINPPNSGDLAQFIAGIDTGGDGVDDEVYVVFYTESGNYRGLYRLASDLTWQTPAYDATDIARITGMERLDVTGGERIVASTVVDGGGRQLISWGAGLTDRTDLQFPLTTNPDDDPTDRVTDDLRDATVFGGTAYFLGRNTLFVEAPEAALSGGAATTLQVVSFGAVTNARNLRGVGVAERTSDTDLLAVVSYDGDVFITEDGVTWDANGGPSRSFADITWVPDIGTGGAFVVATQSDPIERSSRRGYYHAFVSGTAPDFTLEFENDLGNNYNASDLAIASIDSMIYFPSELTVFALTNGLGLWSTTYAGGQTRPDWTWE